MIGCNDCRIDTTLRPTGTDIAFVIKENNINEDDWVGIFESTSKIEKLCTIEEHEEAYEKWCES